MGNGILAALIGLLVFQFKAQAQEWPPQFDWSESDGVSQEQRQAYQGDQGEGDKIGKPMPHRRLPKCRGMKPYECQMFHAVNRVRLKHDLAPLKVYRPCVKAARSHAVDMDLNNYFNHHGFDETWYERMRRFGLNDTKVGENIARVSRGRALQRTLQAWMRSPLHRKNILDRVFRSTGLGYSGGLWVQCFSAHSGD